MLCGGGRGPVSGRRSEHTRVWTVVEARSIASTVRTGDFYGEAIHPVFLGQFVGAKLQHAVERIAHAIAAVLSTQVGHEMTDLSQPDTSSAMTGS